MLEKVMKNFHDLEEKIMKCWQLVDDLDDVASYIAEGETVNQPADLDKVRNMLVGLSQLYNLRFNTLFENYEELLKVQFNEICSRR